MWYSQGTKARKCFKYLNSVIRRWPITLRMPTTPCYLYNFEEQYWSTRAGRKPGLRLSSHACIDLFLRVQDVDHETKIFHIAKTEHHLFVHKSWHILCQWTIAWTCYNALGQILAHKNTFLIQLLNHPLQLTILISNKK